MKNIRSVSIGLYAGIAAIGLSAGAGSLRAAPIEMLNDRGFEATVSPQARQLTWTAADYSSWGVGDELSAVGADNGISPLAGAQMLRFDPTPGAGSDIYQIVDVTAYAAEIDAGLVTADLGAFFNATAGTTVGLTLHGWTAAPTDFVTGFSSLGGNASLLATDADLGTWEAASVTGITVTAGTRYLAFGLHEPTGGATGYADETSLLLNIAEIREVPEPATLALFGLGLAGLGMARRKRTA